MEDELERNFLSLDRPWLIDPSYRLVLVDIEFLLNCLPRCKHVGKTTDAIDRYQGKRFLLKTDWSDDRSSDWKRCVCTPSKERLV